MDVVMKATRLSKHFRLGELTCHCCGRGCPDPLLIRMLEKLREAINEPIHVLSGCRCVKHNEAVGGAKHSYHLRCKAADIRVGKLTPKQLGTKAAMIGFKGVIVYSESMFVHVDVREVRYQRL